MTMTPKPEPKPKLMGDYAPPIRSLAEDQASMAEVFRLSKESRLSPRPLGPNGIPLDDNGREMIGGDGDSIDTD
jgi:hypothetical protein